MSKIKANLHNCTPKRVRYIESEKPFYNIEFRADIYCRGDGISIEKNDIEIDNFFSEKQIRSLRHKITQTLDGDNDLRDAIAYFLSTLDDDCFDGVDDETILHNVFRVMKKAADEDEHTIGIIHDERYRRWEAEQERKDPLGYYGITKPEL